MLFIIVYRHEMILQSTEFDEKATYIYNIQSVKANIQKLEGRVLFLLLDFRAIQKNVLIATVRRLQVSVTICYGDKICLSSDII